MMGAQRKTPAGGLPAGYFDALGDLSGSNHTAPRRQSPADMLLPRLDKVREMAPGRWMARCPAHEDRSPSLSIRQADDRLLIHCFAGCAAEDVLTAVGLTFEDLFDEPLAARERACHRAARNIKEPRRDPLEIERSILRIAQADLEAGKELSVEDRARVELALERLGGEHG